MAEQEVVNAINEARKVGATEEDIRGSMPPSVSDKFMVAAGGLTREEIEAEPPQDLEHDDLAFDPLDDGDDLAEDTSYLYDQPVVKNDPFNRRADLLGIGLLDEYVDGTPPLLSIIRNRQEDNLSSILTVLTARKKEMDKQEIIEAADSIPALSPDDVALTALAANEELSRAEKEALYPDIVAARAALPPDASEEEVLEWAATRSFERQLAGIYEDIGWGDKAWELVKAFVPGHETFRNFSITGEWFGGEDVLRKLYTRFQEASALEKVGIWNDLYPKIKEEHGEIAAAEILGALLSPVGDESFDRYSSGSAAFNIALDAVDFTGIGAAIGSAAVVAGRNASATRALKQARRDVEAGRANAAVVADATGEAADVAGVTREDAATQAVGWDVFADLDVGHTPDLATESQRAFRELLQQRTAALMSEGRFPIGGTYERVAMDRLENLTLSRLEARDEIESVRVASRDPEKGEITFEFMVKGEGQGSLPAYERQTLTVKATRNELGEWEVSSENYVTAFLKSNTAIAKPATSKNFEDLSEDVSTMLQIEGFEAAMQQEFTKLVQQAVRPVLGSVISPSKRNPLLPRMISGSARDSLARIDSVMKTLDKLDLAHVPTPDELRSGSIANTPLNEKEIEVFYNLRDMFDALQAIRNKKTRELMERDGMKAISVPLGTSGDFASDFAKVYEDTGSIAAFLNQSRATEIFDARIQKGVPRDLNLAKQIGDDSDAVLVRTQSPFRVGDKQYNIAVVSRSQIDELPAWVVPYKTNYVPRIYTRGSYFVKAFKPSSVNGVLAETIEEGAITQAIRQFDNLPEAQAYIRQLEETRNRRIAELEDRINAGEDGLREELTDLRNLKYQALADREIERELRASGSFLHTGGGTFTGARAEKAIPFGLKGEEAETLDVFSALQRNIQNVSRFYARSEHKMAMQQKWVNTARSLDKPVNSYADELTGSAPEVIWLNRVKAAIDDFAGVPETEARVWGNLFQSLLNWAMGKALGTNLEKLVPRKVLTNISHVDPAMQLRASAFHMLLGWFNPVQLYVQATGAALAMSANIFNPVELGRVLTRQSALTALDHTDNVQAVAKVAKAVGVSTDELVELSAAWKRSGLRESVRTTADYAAAARNMSVGFDAVRRAADAGLLFYRAGELFNRRVSFITAFREWRKANPTAALTPKVEREIISRANDYMLNLHRANRAQWQKGLLSLPTQFWQVNTKLLESMLGHRFTRSEKIKIVVAQLALFGAAGVPLGSYITKTASEWLGLDGLTEDSLAARTLNGGVIDNLFYGIFQTDIDAADRASIFGGLSDFYYSLFVAEAPLHEKLLGASSVPLERTVQFMKNIGQISAGIQEGASITPQMFLQGADGLLSYASSWTNLRKAFYMQNLGYIENRYGNPQLYGPFSFQQKLATALGFNVSEMGAIRDIKTMNRAKDEYIRGAVDDMTRMMARHLVIAESRGGWENLSDLEKQQIKAQQMAILAPLSNPNDRAKVIDGFLNRLNKGKDEEAEVIRQWIQDGTNAAATEVMGLGSGMSLTQGQTRTDLLIPGN